MYVLLGTIVRHLCPCSVAAAHHVPTAMQLQWPARMSGQSGGPQQLPQPV
jgi:hypothetical protein